MNFYLRCFVIFSLLISVARTSFAVEELNSEGLLQRHLNSIGTAEVRANMKSRVVEGTAAYRVLVGAQERSPGSA